ncbi:TonB-dependent receptor [Desulfobacter curvatus]|uniref:TonB-dependent receptor n=1 Tax=Desulfobacter curvatus TaxID=2290 RepID=UPI00036CAC50|nr:TonB-dependent receptor [Desulfobacter curvatus]
MYRKIILLLLCCIYFDLLLPAAPLWAEEEEGKSVTEMASIIVTANKIEEDIQKVPQSITVMDEFLLEEKGITDVPDVIREVPNMAVTESASGNAVSFRGLNTSTFTNNNPVVIYIDGVPIISQYGFDASLANVERVEVLRGPQGALYGKDAIGGVINIVTKTPENQWHGMIGAEYGRYNYMQGIFNMNGSLITDALYMGINGKYEQDDGWIENTNTQLSSDGNEFDKQQFSGYLLFTPTDRLSARLTLSMDNQSTSWINGYGLPAGTDISAFNRDDAEEVDFDMPTENDVDCFSQSLHLSYAFDAVTLTSTTTHKKRDIEGNFDADYLSGTYYDGLIMYDYSETETYTQELRISSNNESGIRWVGGLYLDVESHEQGPYGMQYPYYDSSGTFYGNFDYNAESDTDSTTYAAFGQAMVPLGERFELTLGGRYQHIDKEIDLDMYYLPVGTTGAPYFSFSEEKDWDVFLPKAALSYRLSDNWHTYISYSQGYMPGGFNYFASSGTTEDNSFESQKSANYELGIKGHVNRFRLAATLFYMDIEDVHVYKSDGVNFYTDNADSAHSQGVELEIAYKLTDTIELTGSLGLIEAKYDTYDAGNGISFDGQDIENTPSYTATAGVSYTQHPGQGFYGRVDMKAAGETYFYADYDKDFVKEDAYITFNAKIGYRTGDWDVYVYGKNLTDEEYIVSFTSNTRLSRADFGDPLTVGIGIRYHF